MTTRLFSFKSSNILLACGLFLTSHIFSSLYAQCPTVTNSTQSFCDIESILVSDLVATDNGGGIVWYDSLASTTPLLSIESLIDGEDYYADDNTGTCGPRQRVDVIIYGPPTGLNFQGICFDDPSTATVANLVATGNNVQWYLTQTGGLPLNDTDILIDDSIYYADQENPDTGCRTSRLSVLVNVGVTPVPIGDAIQEFCVTPGFTPAVENLIASGLNNWYISLFSALPLPPTTPLIDGQVYYASTLDPPCESTGRLAVLVILTDSPDPGDNNTLDLCENDGSIDLFTVLGGTPDSGGTWSPVLNSGTGLFDPNIDTQGVYTYTVSSISICSEQSSTVTVTINPLPNAGTDGSIDLCSNSSAVDLFNSLGGTPEIGGTWSPALVSGTGVFDPTIDVGGIYTYTVLGTPPCANASANVTVIVPVDANAGEDASIDICDDIGTIDLFDSLGGTPDTGGIWSPALASGTGIFDPNIDTDGTYTYTVSGTPPCTDDSASVTVSVNEAPNTGSDGSIDICNTSGTIDLFDSLGGSPDSGGTWSPALASGTGIFDPNIDPEGLYTYSISGITGCADTSSNVNVSVEIGPEAGEDASIDICDDMGTIDLFDRLGGTPDTGGTWSPALASGTSIFDPNIDTDGTYTYTVSGTPPCADASANVTVSISEAPNTGSDGSIDICNTSGTIDLFDSLGGSPDTGGTWSPALNSGTGVFDPNSDAEGIYTYSISGSTTCADASSSVNVSIEIEPEAGEDASIDICDDMGTIDLFDSLGGTPDTGGTWSPALASGTSIFDPNIDTDGTYTYTVSGTPPCADASATVTVSISEAPNTGSDGSIDICNTSGTIDLFDSLGGSPDTGGTWSPALNSGTGVFDPNSDAEGIYTYSISGSTTCADASSNVNVTVESAPEAGEDTSITICSNSDPIDLINSLDGTPDTGGTWSPTLNSGTSIFDPTIDAEGTYTYTVAGTSPCSDASSSITITITDTLDAGENGTISFCTNSGSEDLFNSLEGSPQLGGTWSPTLNSGTGIFDPTIDPEGIYTYTLSGTTASCGDDFATVTVTIIPDPNAGSDNTTTICLDDTATDLFDLLGGSPDANGTWSPALTSGTGVFDPNVDIEGTYTYTVNSTECNLVDTASVTVMIGENPDISGITLTFSSSSCLGFDFLVNISGANQLVDGVYTIVYDITGANTASNTVDITITGGNASFSIPSNLLPNPGITTITVTGFYFSGELCSGDTGLILPIETTIIETQTPQISAEGNQFCLQDNPTIADLSSNIIDSDPIIWYNLPNGGIAYSESDLLQNGVTYYAAIQGTNGCESTIRLSVTVTVIECLVELIIPDGFSPNNDGINDDFHIVNLDILYPNFKLSVFNRYGNILYEGNINSDRWDGSSKNKDKVLPVGVYFFILEFNDSDRKPIQGRVYLSR